MSKKKIIITLWFLFASTIFLNGQETVSFSSLSKLNGLSNNTINDIKQDTSGYIWIATNKGLNRFDGLEFKTYQSNSSEILQSDYIYCLEIDSKNRLWFGTADGRLYYLSTEEDKLYSIAEGLLSINAILESEDGRFWIGTKSGLYLMNQSKQDQYSFQQFSDLNVKAIKYKNGNLWLATSSGVYYLDNLSQQIIPIAKEELGNELVIDIEFNGDKELWIATRRKGVFIYEMTTKDLLSIGEKVHQPSLLDLKNVRKILKGTHQKIYIGTDGAGLIIYDNLSQKVEQFTNTTNSNSIASNTIFSIYEDRNQNIWMGHIRKGISIINNDKDKVNVFFRENLSREYSDILSIYEETNGDILCGTDGRGLFQINKKTNEFEDLNNHPNLGNTYVQSIFRDSKNRLWMGTFSKGVFVQNPNANPRQLESNANEVRGFCEDSKGNIWIATNGQGLFKYHNNGIISQYLHQPGDSQSLSSDYILSMRFFDGKVYLATDGGGLNILDTETEEIEQLVQQEETNSLLGNNLICLFVQSKDDLWVGSTLGITNIIQKNGQQQFIRYSFDDLSFRRFILGILVDDNQQVWISTDEGLYRLEQTSGNFFKVNLGSPFNSTEFHYNACHKSENGMLWFGGVNGLFSFYPEKLFQVARENKVKITGFKTFGKDESTKENSGINHLMQIKKKGHVTIGASTSLIQIDFANIGLPSSKEYQYLVKLENVDEDWQHLGNARTVSYENLPSGNYTFNVKCLDAFGQKSNPITSFQFTVLIPVWKSWWAIIIYFALLTGVFYLAYNYLQRWRKMKKNLKNEKLTREREEALRKMQVTFFTNISHDLRTPLTLIIGNIKRLVKQQDKQKSQPQELNIIENNINQLLRLSNELLDFRKIETGKFKLNLIQGDISVLLKETFYAFYDHAAERNIQYECLGMEEEIFILFDYDQLEKVFFNLLSNAFKFTSSSGKIQLAVYNSAPDYLQISIINTGQTLSKQQRENIFNRFYQDSQNVEDKTIGPGVGIGLSIVKDIVDLHQGRIDVESADGTTSFILYLKKEMIGSNAHHEKEILSSVDRIEDYIDQEKIITPTLSLEQQNEFKDACVLVVEDNYDLRKFLVTALEENYRVLEAENGKQAFDMTLQDLPDLIVSDVMMPEMDGISLCFELKTNIKTSHIPVILLTARKSRYYKLKGLETGADDYISKPFYEDELKIRIRNLLKIRKELRDRFTLEAMAKPEEVKLNAPDQQFIKNLCQIIEENIDNSSLKAKDVSQEMNMSHSLVYKKLKAMTGYTLVEFIRDYRLQKAEMLLVQNQLTIAEICYQVGFGDRHYFSTCFKKKYQMSPREYLNAKNESA